VLLAGVKKPNFLIPALDNISSEASAIIFQALFPSLTMSSESEILFSPVLGFTN